MSKLDLSPFLFRFSFDWIAGNVADDFHSVEVVGLLDGFELDLEVSGSGVLVVNYSNGNIEQWIWIKDPIRELYDVIVLPGIRRSRLVGLKTDDIPTVVWQILKELQR